MASRGLVRTKAICSFVPDASYRAARGPDGLPMLRADGNVWVRPAGSRAPPYRCLTVVRGARCATRAFASFADLGVATGWERHGRLVSDAALTCYFGVVYFRQRPLRIPWTLRRAREILQPALTIGAAQAMGLLNYNFDSVLLGFLSTARTVGLYNAAYKPVTIALALPLTYFIGLFPALSRTHAEGPAVFRPLVERSLRLSALMVVPLAVGGTLLAQPIILLLYGANYAQSAQVLSILIWSAVLVILRGSYRHSLIAAGHQGLDLRCAILASCVNVGLNLLLIPRFGMIGAAAATVAGDAVWFVMAFVSFERRVMPLNPLPYVARPVLAGAAMAACLLLLPSLFWIERAMLSVIVYFLVLLILREPEVRTWTLARSEGADQQRP